jgi:vacuolar-type H+-ATPase subunit I/STV1
MEETQNETATAVDQGPDMRPTITNQQYSEIKEVLDVQEKVQARGYPILKRKMILEQQLSQLNQQYAQVENELEQINQAAKDKFNAVMAPLGLQEFVITIEEDEPHYLNVHQQDGTTVDPTVVAQIVASATAD